MNKEQHEQPPARAREINDFAISDNQAKQAEALAHYIACRRKHPLRRISEVIEAW